jgi:hypothetical protein
MRRVVVTMAAITLLTTSALAQGRPGAKSAPPEPAKVKQETRPVVDEKDYKAALDRIPTPTEKPDPWGNLRTVPKQK